VPVVACLAPAFPAEFFDLGDETRVVGMLRALGFAQVVEVGFGADLVAKRYHKLVEEREPGASYIATPCPAVVGYVLRYAPSLTDRLAPIVSPMVAMARVLRRLHPAPLRVVFIGPCIAKKSEAVGLTGDSEIDGVITFRELRALWRARGITPETVTPSDFDGPRSGLGALFPLSHGLLRAAELREDLIGDEVVALTGGARAFIDAIDELARGEMTPGLLETLSCAGCIMGPGMTTRESLFRRRAHVADYVRRRFAEPAGGAAQDLSAFDDLDLSCSFEAHDRRMGVPADDELRVILRRMKKNGPQDELNCGACGYHTCREHAAAIYAGLAESEMCLPYVIGELSTAVIELRDSHDRLEDAREQLMHSEKLASMGQLAAGVAHEINNPLGVVLMYAHMLMEEVDGAAPMRKDLSMIATHADRCKRVVANLLDFARENKLLLQDAVIDDLVTTSLESVGAPKTITIDRCFGHHDGRCEVDPTQIVQVFTNILSNALAAMPDGGSLRVVTSDDPAQLTVRFVDTGTGIPAHLKEKVFQPFFTTKSMGKGTGLGLAVCYGIVKMHRGQISVESNTDAETGPTGSTFTVTLPRYQRQAAM